jgi:16S rRNA (guanine(527)-N(7))-methyltransferase RsmG
MAQEQSKHERLWREFAERAGLSERQLEQFQLYYKLLIEANELFNLTSITELAACISYHFEDSLIISDIIDFKALTCIADIGAGAGFPGIPLKIQYPNITLILIEVSHKKREFLEHVCNELELDNVEISAWDWRTFLRKTDYPIELFCARASLHPDELIRMFKPASPYKDSLLVYWASAQWQPGPREALFIVKEYPYKTRYRNRKLVIFKRNQALDISGSSQE